MITKEMIPPAVNENRFRFIQHKRREIVPELEDEGLKWMRFEVGLKYIQKMNVPPEEKDLIKRSKAFWKWLHQIWYLNDLKIVKICMKEVRTEISPEVYEESQLAFLIKYKVNRAAMQAALQENATTNE